MSSASRNSFSTIATPEILARGFGFIPYCWINNLKHLNMMKNVYTIQIKQSTSGTMECCENVSSS